MTIKIRSAIASSILAAFLWTPNSANAYQASTAKDAAKDTAKEAASKASKAPKTKEKIAPFPAPSAKEIADAKAGGMVWVNLNSKVYHKDGEYFGKTKRGKFMSEADANKAGFKAAKEPGAAKAKAPKVKEPKK